jgi:hypothetical protein
MWGPIPFISRVEDNDGMDDAGDYGADQDKREQRTDKARYPRCPSEQKT